MRYAFVDVENNRIDREIEVPEGQVLLPIEYTEDELGQSHVLGLPEITIKKDRVNVHRSSQRALSGRVAILSEKGDVEEIKDLGEQLVPVADNVRIFIEDKPDFDPETQRLEGPEDVINSRTVRRVWKVHTYTKAELEKRWSHQQEAELQTNFGDERGMKLLFEMQQTIRELKGEKPYKNFDEFREELKSRL